LSSSPPGSPACSICRAFSSTWRRKAKPSAISACSAWRYIGYGIGSGPGNAWMHAKLFLVILVIGYHHACGSLLKKFENGRNQRSHKWFRWFNEVPVLLLLGIVILVVVKPF